MYNFILQLVIGFSSSSESKKTQTLALGLEGLFETLLFQSTKQPVTVGNAKEKKI